MPLFTLLLIAANIVVFLFVQPGAFHGSVPTSQTDRDEASFLYENAVVPCELTHWSPLSPSLVASCSGARVGPATATPFFPHKSIALSVLASMFLHANWVHLIGNLWFLWIFGDNVEDRLGRLRYLGCYFAAGVAATLGQVALTPNSVAPLLGASGAIAGVLGAYLVLFPRAKVISVFLPLFFLPFVLSARVLLLVWFVLQFFTNPNSGVAWAAHVAGFIFGIVFALVATPRARAPAVGSRPGSW
ncbi:MAG TPA: rhomboid family intramembrane serine protease [Acidimicrobiales bacterium]